MNPYFKEIFEYPISEFKSHLESESNDRILFSGKYGIGKTRFLQDFFSNKFQQQLFKELRYDVYRLAPINYSIASNEDIIKYIKYDIIIELLRKKSSIDELKLDFLGTLPIYLQSNLHKVLATVLYMVPKLGKELVGIVEKVNALKEEFQKFQKKINESDGDKMISYLEQIELYDGSIYANDVITKIITQNIKNEKSKNSILIVDDVDRIDPEHVFRILNVFASHFDGTTLSEKNKFGFDKVIIVCDFHNIRRVFQHRFGNEVDFMGYMDKYYSSDVYFFNNKKAIKNIIEKILNSIKYETIGQSERAQNSEIPYLQELYFSNTFLKQILELFIDRSFISLRNILKVYDKRIGYHYENITFSWRNKDIDVNRIPILMQIKLLLDFLGDYRNMKLGIEKCLTNHESIKEYKYLFAQLIYILSMDIHDFVIEEPLVFEFHGLKLLIQTRRRQTNHSISDVEVFEVAKVDQNGVPTKGNKYQPTSDQFWQSLLDVIDMLHRIDYLH